MNPNDEKQNYWETQDGSEGEPQDEFRADQAPIDTASVKQEPADTPITWTAQEYVHIDKSPVWFVLFTLVVLGFIAVDIFLLKSWTFSALVIVMAVAVIIYTRRPPRSLTYGLSIKQGLYVGERLYHFDDFKAFGVIRDGEHHSIMLIPTKRFAPGVSVYFPEESGETIVDILGQRLPMENLKLDIIDILVRKLRL
ncbi:hypothetical protein H7200_00715 [Candidatus Saccharibacteria bacterium]|nr:hypothetical protein [Candidatus Saccharibacteria bacterium]